MRYEELTPAQLTKCVETRSPVVVPVSQLEPQGDLLPLGADKLILESVLREASKITPFVYLPTLHVVACTDFRYWPGLISFKPETAIAAVRELAQGVFGQGFKKLTFAMYYGGHNFNLLDVVLGGMELEPDRSVVLLRLPQLIPDAMQQLVESGIDAQYSLLAHLRPDLVNETDLAAVVPMPTGREQYFKSRSTYIRYDGSLDMTGIFPQGPYGGFGGASAHEGAQLFGRIVQEFAGLISRVA